MNIHPSAVVHPSAKIPASCCIGPFCHVGPEVEMGERCELISHVVLGGPTRMGNDNRIFPFASVGLGPQDLSYKGEPTRLEIGDNNQIREFVTIHRGTVKGGGLTKIGSHTLIMAYAHIAHDCLIGDWVIMANAATLAGHVTVENYAVVGALCAVHQFVKIGEYSYIGGGTIITQDVLPFSKTSAVRDVNCLRRQLHRPPAPRFLIRAYTQNPARLPGAAGLQAEHLASRRAVTRRRRLGRRRRDARPLHRGL